MDVVDCARLFALSSIAGVDAFIAVFDAKYTYNLWRPVTTIRKCRSHIQCRNAARRDHGRRSALPRCIPNIRARTA